MSEGIFRGRFSFHGEHAPSDARHMHTDESGATAVEFSFVVLPFMLIFLGLMYSGFLYWANLTLDKNLENIARAVYDYRPLCGTGAGGANFPYTSSCLRDRICAGVRMILVSEAECRSTLLVDLRVLNGDGSDPIPPMVTGSTINAGSFGEIPGAVEGKMVMIRALLPFPNFAIFAPESASLEGGKRALMAATAFRVKAMPKFDEVFD
jgi:hypothetical protein